MKVREILGYNIQRLRKTCGMTQEGVAIRLNTSKQYISALETGKQWIGADNLDQLKSVFASTYDDFFVTPDQQMNNNDLNRMLYLEIALMDQTKRARLYARAVEINER